MEWGDVRRERCWGQRETGRAMSRNGWTQMERVGEHRANSHACLGYPRPVATPEKDIGSAPAPKPKDTKLSFSCPTSTCLMRSTPLPAHLPAKLSKPLSHRFHLPPGQCRWLAQPEPSGQEEPKPGGWKEKGGCREQAGTCGWCDHSLGLA